LTLIERYCLPTDVAKLDGQPPALFPSCFVPASDRLCFLLERNFLFDFDHSGSPDYLRLLSPDYRRLFFHFWGQSERICVSGPEGCGKTFNTLLLTEQLRSEGYDSYYTSAREAGLSAASLSVFATLTGDRGVLLIDDCQDDLEKTKGLLEEASRSKRSTAKPRIVFLTHPLEPEDHIDTFGQGMPTLNFFDRFNDLPTLAALFFEKLHRRQDIRSFLSALRTETLSRELFRYRNMEFWNTYFNTTAHTAAFTFDSGPFYTKVYNYLRDKEPAFIDPSQGLVSLLPFFANGLPVLRDWAIRRLGITEKQLSELSSRSLIREKFLDWDNSSWENDTAVFVVGAVHPTKARLASLVAAKYGGVSCDDLASLAAYASGQLPNPYYVVSPLFFSSPDLLIRLCANAEFQATLRAYVMQRHLGKHLDRVLTRLARIATPVARTLMDPAVLDSLVTRLNEERPYVISKVLLLRAIQRIDPSLAYEVFKGLNHAYPIAATYRYLAQSFASFISTVARYPLRAKWPRWPRWRQPDRHGLNLDLMVAAFKAGVPGARLSALSKLMEVLKNIYYAAPGGEEKAGVAARVRQMVDECSSEMVEALERTGSASCTGC